MAHIWTNTNKPKRVVFLADANSIHTARFANALVDEGVSIKIVSLRPLHGQIYKDGVTFHGIHLDRSPSRWELFKFIFIANLLSVFWRPSFIHAHYCSSYGAYSRHVYFTKKIISVWGSDVLIRMKKSKLVRAKSAKAMAKAQAILCTSEVLARETSVHTKTPIFRTPFGIDAEVFSPIGDKYEPIERLRAANPELFVIGCAKWLNKIYGIDILVNAVADLLNSNPRWKVLLVLTGEGPDREEIERLIDERGIREIVLLTGAVPHREMPNLHRSFDLAVYPSRSESFGVSILESSSCGVPVIGTHEGGIPEVVKNGSTGLLVRSNNAPDLARAIARLKNDPERRSQLGKSGRAYVEQNYQWKFTVEKLLQIYSASRRKMKLDWFVDDNPVFPTAGDFSIFYYPFRLEAQSKAARPIRVRAIKDGLSQDGEVVEIMGDDASKKRGFAKVKYFQSQGKKAVLFYGESHSIPTLTMERLKRLNFFDYKLFRWVKAQKIPNGIFLRDFYAFDKSLSAAVGYRRFLELRLLQLADLRAYKKFMDVIFVPCEPFARRVREFLPGKSLVPLPPATSAPSQMRSLNVQKKDLSARRLKLVYIGGLGYHYDMRHLVSAVTLCNDFVDLDIICRPRDLTADRWRIGSFMSAENVNFLHEDQEFFLNNAASWDMSVLVRQPHSYIEIAYPVKIFDYVRAGLPILISKGQHAEKLVNEAKLGISVYNEVNSIVSALRKIYEDMDALDTIKPNLTAFAEVNNWNDRVSTIKEVLLNKDGS